MELPENQVFRKSENAPPKKEKKREYFKVLFKVLDTGKRSFKDKQ
jgi:hypothetical protein